MKKNSRTILSTDLKPLLIHCAARSSAKRNEMVTRWGNGKLVSQRNFLGCDLVAIDICAGFIVWAKGGALKGNTGKQTTGTRVAEDIRP